MTPTRDVSFAQQLCDWVVDHGDAMQEALISDAAAHFGRSEDDVRAAARQHYWMYVRGDKIGIDGE